MKLRPPSLAMKYSSAITVIASLTYSALITWLYRNEVAAIWASQGFRLNDDGTSLLLIAVATILTSLALPNNGDTRSILLSTAYFMFFLPSTVFAFIAKADSYYIILLFLSFLIIIPLSALKIEPIRLGHFGRKQFLCFLLVLSFVVVFVYAAISDFRSLNFDLASVYLTREENAEYFNGFLGYFVSLVSVILLPMAMIYSIAMRSYITLMLAIIIQIIFFGITNFKSILFSPILVISMYYFLRAPYRRFYTNLFFLTLPAAITANVIVQRIFLQSDDIVFTVNHFIRRLLFVPPMLDERYIVFFSNNPFYYWSTSRFSLGLTENPYGHTAPFTIGLEYFGSDTWAANTGMIGSGFANAGIFGVILYAFFFGLLLALFNAYGRRIGHSLVSSICVLTVLNITRSSDFTTVIFTHGLVFLISFLIIMPPQSNEL